MASRGRLIWSHICRGSWENGLLPCCDLSKLFPVDRLNPNKMATGQTLSSGLHNRIYDAAVATPVFSNVYTEILVVRERLFNEAFKYLLSDFFENIIVSAAINRGLAGLRFALPSFKRWRQMAASPWEWCLPIKWVFILPTVAMCSSQEILWLLGFCGCLP